MDKPFANDEVKKPESSFLKSIWSKTKAFILSSSNNNVDGYTESSIHESRNEISQSLENNNVVYSFNKTEYKPNRLEYKFNRFKYIPRNNEK